MTPLVSSYGKKPVYSKKHVRIPFFGLCTASIHMGLSTNIEVFLYDVLLTVHSLFLIPIYPHCKYTKILHDHVLAIEIIHSLSRGK